MASSFTDRWKVHLEEITKLFIVEIFDAANLLTKATLQNFLNIP